MLGVLHTVNRNSLSPGNTRCIPPGGGVLMKALRTFAVAGDLRMPRLGSTSRKPVGSDKGIPANSSASSWIVRGIHIDIPPILWLA